MRFSLCVSLFYVVCLFSKVFGKPKDYGLSGELVSTPIGYRPTECVLHAEEDEVILKSIKGVGMYAHYPSTKRTVFHPEIPACIENGLDLMKERQQKIANRKNATKTVGNLKEWEVYAGETVSKMGTFTSQYQLPSDSPTIGKNVILYYFIGMQNNDNADITIIQPVIEYCDTCGTGSQAGWNMSPWNCCPNGQTWQGTVKVVTAGAYIDGTIISNSTYDYIECYNPSNDDITTLTVADTRRTFDWICFTLEQYNVVDCTDYPSDPFWSRTMKVTDSTGTSITPSWDLTNGDGCGGEIQQQDAFDLALYSKTS